MAEIFFRSRRLASTEAMVPPAKPTTTILPSHARLRGKGEEKKIIKGNVHSQPLGWLLFKKRKKKQKISVGKDLEKWKPHGLLVGL